jgi:DNA-binding protein HU-beta
MNRKEFVKAVAKRAGITKREAAAAINAIFEVIKETLKKGEEVRFTGFGTFKVITRRERRGRNPRTGEKIVIPAIRVVRFYPGAKLKNL